MQSNKSGQSREIVQQIPLWDDKTDPEAFIEAFVMAMTEAKRPEEQWIPTLRKRLTGKALSTFREISPADNAPFVTLKEDLLKRMGATIGSAREEDLQTFNKKMFTAINRVKATWSVSWVGGQQCRMPCEYMGLIW